MSEQVIAANAGTDAAIEQPINHWAVLDPAQPKEVVVDPALDSMFKWQDINILLASVSTESEKANLLMKHEEWKNATKQSGDPEAKWHNDADSILAQLDKDSTPEPKVPEVKKDDEPQKDDDGKNDADLSPEEITQFVELHENVVNELTATQAELADVKGKLKVYQDNLGDTATMKIQNERLIEENRIYKTKIDESLQEKAKWDLDKQSINHKMIEPKSDEHRMLFKTLNQDFDSLDTQGKANVLEQLSVLWERMTGNDLYDNIQSFIRMQDAKPENIENNISLWSAYSSISKVEQKTAEAAADRNYM